MKRENWALVKIATGMTIVTAQVETVPRQDAVCPACGIDRNDNQLAAATQALAALGFRVEITEVA